MIQLDENSWQAMTADAISTFPDECCGFLLGKEEEGDRRVTGIIVVNNAKEGDKRRRFEIHPKDYLKAEMQADEQGLQLLGVYHSHPNHPAIPSEHDRVAAQPYFSYLIVSVMEGKLATVRSWRLNDEQQFEEETINQPTQLQTI